MTWTGFNRSILSEKIKWKYIILMYHNDEGFPDATLRRFSFFVLVI